MIGFVMTASCNSSTELHGSGIDDLYLIGFLLMTARHCLRVERDWSPIHVRLEKIILSNQFLLHRSL